MAKKHLENVVVYTVKHTALSSVNILMYFLQAGWENMLAAVPLG